MPWTAEGQKKEGIRGLSVVIFVFSQLLSELVICYVLTRGNLLLGLQN
jgi:hypothetical protein